MMAPGVQEDRSKNMSDSFFMARVGIKSYGLERF